MAQQNNWHAPPHTVGTVIFTQHPERYRDQRQATGNPEGQVVSAQNPGVTIHAIDNHENFLLNALPDWNPAGVRWALPFPELDTEPFPEDMQMGAQDVGNPVEDGSNLDEAGVTTSEQMEDRHVSPPSESPIRYRYWPFLSNLNDGHRPAELRQETIPYNINGTATTTTINIWEISRHQDFRYFFRFVPSHRVLLNRPNDALLPPELAGPAWEQEFRVPILSDAEWYRHHAVSNAYNAWWGYPDWYPPLPAHTSHQPFIRQLPLPFGPSRAPMTGKENERPSQQENMTAAHRSETPVGEVGLNTTPVLGERSTNGGLNTTPVLGERSTNRGLGTTPVLSVRSANGELNRPTRHSPDGFSV